jgi:hypothetical protein
MEALLPPLSSRPKWRDLRFSQPVADADGSSAPPFVINRSGGICSSLNRQLIRMETPPFPLSSRPERSEADGSAVRPFRSLRFTRIYRRNLNSGGGVVTQEFVVLILLGSRKSLKPQILHCAPPDFLSNLVGSASFMRLSLRKAAHAALSRAAQQEIRVRSVEKHFPERSAELKIPRLPRISC